jgi:hypothetical protein
MSALWAVWQALPFSEAALVLCCMFISAIGLYLCWRDSD